jgi:ribonuclease-3
MAHRSYCAEHPGQPSNERLELLGDSVLGLVVTDHLYRAFPNLPEGDLARVRAAVVSTFGLAPLARRLGIGERLLLGKGEEASGGRDKASILVDSFEAVIGAVYLSAGFAGAQSFVEEIVGPEVSLVASEARLGDPKNQLQEMSAHLGYGAPTYAVTEKGPDHAKRFTAVAILCGRRVGEGESGSKKDAERRAAQDALTALAGAAGGLEGFPLSAGRA